MNQPPGGLTCKYLGIPITYGFGLLNKARESNNVNPRKLRLTGPFFSIGVAMRYYTELWQREKIKDQAYHSYMFNLGDQVKAFEQLEEQLKNEAALAAAETAKAAALLKQNNPAAAATTDQPKDSQPKAKKAAGRPWTDRHSSIIYALMSPCITDLETHGGSLTRQQYEKIDKTLAMHHSLTCYFTQVEYENQKNADAAARLANKKRHDPDGFLYFIDFRKNLPDAQAYHLVPVDHPAFVKYLSTQAHRTHVLQSKQGDGVRVIWYGGAFANKRASSVIFGKRLAKEYKLRGSVWCWCSKNFDLSIKGGISLNTNWKGPEEVDLGDNADAMQVESKKAVTPVVLPVQAEDSDSDEDSDGDYSSDEEPAPTPAPAPKSKPPPSKRQRV